jgi:hypothetical protein
MKLPVNTCFFWDNGLISFAGGSKPMVSVFPLIGEERVALQGVSWKFYESMLQELGEARVVRVTYDRGALEIMRPLPKN